MKTVKHIFDRLNYPDNISPAEAYILYLLELRKENSGHPSVYLSNALTSGGFKRTTLTHEEAYLKNAELSDAIRNLLYAQSILNSEELVLFPKDTKGHSNWKQFEFNFFFSLIILGIEDEEIVINLEKYINENVIMDGFINQEASRQERIISYNSLRDLILIFIKDHNIKINPPRILVQLLDNEVSLGSTLEGDLARALGTKIFRVQINLNIKDSSFSEIINSINYIKGVDSTFNFFGDGATLQDKPIYLIEV